MPTNVALAPKDSGAKDERQLAMMNKVMVFMMPAFTLYLGFQFVAGLTLYWLVTTLVAILQQWLFLRGVKKAKAAAGTAA
jgi:membrane protein insertase Oxa1/YidC/SpoIIIJ